MMHTPRPVLPRAASRTHVIVWPGLLFGSWILAWLLCLFLRGRYHWSPSTDTIYWIAMKAILWVLPALLAIRLFEHADVIEFLELSASRLRPGLIWGLAVGAALVVITYLGKHLPAGAHPREVTFSLVFVNAVIVAPLVEEIAMRGFFLKALEGTGCRSGRQPLDDAAIRGDARARVAVQRTVSIDDRAGAGDDPNRRPRPALWLDQASLRLALRGHHPARHQQSLFRVLSIKQSNLGAHACASVDPLARPLRWACAKPNLSSAPQARVRLPSWRNCSGS